MPTRAEQVSELKKGKQDAAIQAVICLIAMVGWIEGVVRLNWSEIPGYIFAFGMIVGVSEFFRNRKELRELTRGASRGQAH